jgi:multidrug efflux pump subunit AcrA (membrane-fusion protein)
VTKKILLIVMLAAFAAVATEALSQSPGGSTPTAPGANAPAPNKAAPPAAEKTPASTKNIPSSSKSPSSGKDASKDASSTKTVPTSTVTPGNLSAPKAVVVERAVVTLINDNKVPATEAGMILGPLPVEEGSSVEKDGLVAQIDNRSTLAKQKIAEAEYMGAKAQSENVAEVEVAEAAIKVSEEEYQMNLDIQKKNPAAVSASQVRKDKFNLEKAGAQKKQALSEQHIAGLTANAKYAQYEAASIELDLRQIKSPFKGEVVEIMKRPGDWVTAGEPIMHIVGLDKVRVKGFVFASGENVASQADVYGKDVTIEVDAAGGKKATVKGKIGFASPVLVGVGTTRQFAVWAEVDNETTTDPVTKQVTWKLQPGSVAKMTIDLSAPKVQPTSTRTQTYRPVTGDEKSETKKSETKKSKREF